jgi:hypothetical protein
MGPYDMDDLTNLTGDEDLCNYPTLPGADTEIEPDADDFEIGRESMVWEDEEMIEIDDELV